MAIKPFEIQSPSLVLAGVQMQAGATGVVIPGVTQATTYSVEEVDDTGDQTVTWGSIPTVIDNGLYAILNGGSEPAGYVASVYEVEEIDDNDYIDEIIVTTAGSFPASYQSTVAQDMWATTVADPFTSFNPSDWTQIPFAPQIRAGEVENISGGGGIAPLGFSYETGNAELTGNFSVNNDNPSDVNTIIVNPDDGNLISVDTLMTYMDSKKIVVTISDSTGKQASYDIANIVPQISSYNGYKAVFTKQWGDDPGFSKIGFFKETATANVVTQTDTDNDEFTVNILSGSSDLLGFAIIYTDNSNFIPTNNNLNEYFEYFVDNVLVPASGNITNIKTNFYSQIANTSAIVSAWGENPWNLEFYTNSVQSIYNDVSSSTSGSGTGFTANIIPAGDTSYRILSFNGGTGYQVGDTITFDGASLGGGSGTNDYSLTVATVDGDGVVLTFSDTGTNAGQWPTDYISDGGSDIYDGGNYLNTNLQPTVPYSDGVIQNTGAFNTNEWFVGYAYGQFIFFGDNTGGPVTSFGTHGETGADGDGTRETGDLTAPIYYTLNVDSVLDYHPELNFDGGTFTISYDIGGPDTNGVVFDQGNVNTITTSSGDLYIKAADDVRIQAADYASLRGGDKLAGRSTQGGFVGIYGGAGSDANTNVGFEVTAATGGDVEIFGGSAGYDGGNTNLGASGGRVYVEGGAATGNNNGGEIRLQGGSGAGTGTAGNIVVVSGGYTWSLDNAGYLTVPGSVTRNSSDSPNLITATTTDNNWALGFATSGSEVYTQAKFAGNSSSTHGFKVLDTTSGNKWVFDGVGNLTVPGTITGPTSSALILKGGPASPTGQFATSTGATYGYGGALAIFAASDFTSGAVTDVQVGNVVVENNGATANVITVQPGIAGPGTYGITLDQLWNQQAPFTWYNGYGNDQSVKIQSGSSNLVLDGSGNLTLPGNTFSVNYANGTPVSLGSADLGNITVSNITLQGVSGYSGGIQFSASPDDTANLKYLQVRSGDLDSHIHFDTGNNEAYDQYFGNDFKYLKLEAGAGLSGNVSIGTYQDGGVGQLTWIFDSDGNLTVPNSAGGVIKTVANGAIAITAINGGSDNPAQMMSWTDGAPGPDTIISAYSSNALIQSNVTGAINTWTFDDVGNLTLPGSLIATTASPAPTINGFSITNSFSIGCGNLTATGNVSAGNIIGNGQALTGIAGANVTGAVGYASVANSVAVANVSGIGNIATINLDGSSSNVLYGNGVFAAVSSSSSTISNGTSNVNIASSDGNVQIVSAGNIIANITDTGANLTGTLNVSGSASVGNLTVSGNSVSLASNTTVSTTVSIGGNNSNATTLVIGNSTSGGSSVIAIGNGYNYTSASQSIGIGNAGQAIASIGIGNARGLSSGQQSVSIGIGNAFSGVMTASAANAVNIGIGNNSTGTNANVVMNIGGNTSGANATVFIGIGGNSTQTGFGRTYIGIGNGSAGTNTNTYITLADTLGGSNTFVGIGIANNINGGNSTKAFQVDIGTSGSSKGAINIGNYSVGTPISMSGNVTVNGNITVQGITNPTLQASNVYATQNLKSAGNVVMTTANTYYLASANGGMRSNDTLAANTTYTFSLFDDATADNTVRRIYFASNTGNTNSSSNTTIYIGDSIHPNTTSVQIYGNINANLSTANTISRGTTTVSIPAWTTSGTALKIPAASYQDYSTAAGTQANNYISVLDSPTIRFSNAVTVTNAATLYVAAPTAGTNATFTNSYAMIANGKVNVIGNITANNLGNVSAVNLDGSSSNVLYGNGVFAPASGGGSYGDSNVVSLLNSFGSNTITTTGNIQGGNVTALGTLTRSGSVSASAWNNTGIGFTIPAATYTDTTTAAGTQANNYVHVMSAPTVAYSNAVTVTNAATLAVYPPTAGTNATVSGTYAILAWGNVGVSANFTAGNAAITGNISAGNITSSGIISATGNVTTGGQITSTAFTGANISWTATGTTDFQGNIKVGGSGIIKGPGGASSLTLNNNGANTGTLGVTGTTAATSTTTGSAIISGGAGIAGNAYVGGTFVRSGAVTQTAWTTNGVGLVLASATYTDNSTAAGTQASSYIHNMAAPTLAFSNAVTVTNATTMYVDAPVAGTNATLTNKWAITANGNVQITNGNLTANTGGYAIGYRDVPQIAASNTTLSATDGGKHYYSTTAGNFTLTIPNNATTSFATGTAISIVVQAAGNILVNAASGVTLYMAGNSTAANRYVNAYGMATLLKVGSDTWFINGTGVN